MNYKRIYGQIIKNRLANPLPESEYGQKHHILPKSLYPQYAKTKTNIVKLTYREHYICHWLLTKIKPCRQMSNAFWQMNNTKSVKYFNSTAYEKCKKMFVEKLKEFNKGKTPWNKGISPSEETRKKLSTAFSGKNNPNYGKICSEETKKKISNSQKGKTSWNKNKPRTEEEKIKIRNAVLGKKWINDGITETQIDISNGIPEGFVLGRVRKMTEATKRKISEKKKGSNTWNKGLKNCYTLSEETKQKLRDKMKNKRWINNGDKQIYMDVSLQLPEGYEFGRLKRIKYNCKQK